MNPSSMSQTSSSLLRRLLTGESGQMLPVMALMITALLGMAGFTIDLGRALYTHNELQASTDAAAMAGAHNLPSTAAIATATQYGSATGSLNAESNLPGVTMVAGYPKIVCLTTLSAQGMACVAPGNGNALVVKQQIVLPLYVLPILGVRTLTLTASATASMQGSISKPYNVVIVVDSTGSMNGPDTGSNCTTSRLTCALAGVQILLQNLSPCGTGLTSCGTPDNTGNVSNAVDRVSLYTFPALTSAADVQKDGDCSGTPSVAPYTFPVSPQPPPLYQIVNFTSDYRSSDTNATLTSGSSLVKAAGGGKSCSGLQAPGGSGTFYAGVIYAAQDALVAQAQQNAGTKNVMVLLSDGDASAPANRMTGANNTGTYPSTKNQCQQAVDAANAATRAGTLVYTVAYGATSSGCATDNPNITPCQTMEQMASAPQNFFSDYKAGNGSSPCVSAAQSTANLNQIFQQIAGGLTVGRLIPDSTP